MGGECFYQCVTTSAAKTNKEIERKVNNNSKINNIENISKRANEDENWLSMHKIHC